MNIRNTRQHGNIKVKIGSKDGKLQLPKNEQKIKAFAL